MNGIAEDASEARPHSSLCGRRTAEIGKGACPKLESLNNRPKSKFKIQPLPTPRPAEKSAVQRRFQQIRKPKLIKNANSSNPKKMTFSKIHKVFWAAPPSTIERNENFQNSRNCIHFASRMRCVRRHSAVPDWQRFLSDCQEELLPFFVALLRRLSHSWQNAISRYQNH